MIDMDDQPISATFFDEGRWLSSFVTPNALEVEELHKELTKDLRGGLEPRLAALHQWVATRVKYKRFISGRIVIEGRSSIQNDLWNNPSITARIGVGNCANKAFLLASLIRKELPPNQVYVVLGNLYNGKASGHAWVQVQLGESEYIIESTQASVKTLIPTYTTNRYEAVHLFNDQQAYFIEGKTVMQPFSACYSTWLRDYLDMAYINSR